MAEIGQVIAKRYRLMELRGEDAVSTVFRALDSENSRPVVVRVLSPEFGADPDFVAEFRLAMRAAAGLSHPNLVAIYDFGTDSADAYVVTELIDGQELHALLQRNGPVPPRRAASVTSVVGAAVAAAHERGIVHGGVRSGSVIVTRDGQIKLADLGLARALAESSQRPALSVDQAWYQSPEQARGRRATDASDVYALGVLLFELLTGRGPWDGETVDAVAKARLADPNPTPSDFQGGVPAEIETIDRKAMATEPAGRFDSAETLADTLEATVAQLDSQGAAATADDAAGAEAGAEAAAEPEPESEAAAAAEPERSPYARPVPVPVPVVRPVAAAPPPVPPVVPPPVPPSAPLVRRPNPVARVTYAADAYATRPPDQDDLAADPRGQGAYAPDGVANRATRRINPGDSQPEQPEDEGSPASTWAWVAGFLALFLITLLGLTIYLLISRGSSGSTVYAPNLVNVSYSDAQQTAQSYGLQISVAATATNNGSQADRQITFQNPAAGMPMNKGDTIYVTVVSGSSQVVVPNVVGLVESDALNALTSAGLAAGNRTETYDPTIPEGQVVATNPKKDLSVLRGSAVDYVVSLGPQPTPTPTDSPTPSPTPTPTDSPTPSPTPTPTPSPTPSPTPTPTPTPTAAPTASPTAAA